MTANFNNRTIEMSAAEAKRTGRVGTEEYHEYCELHALFPDYRIAVRKNNRTGKRIKKEKIEEYVRKYGNEKQQKEYDELTTKNDVLEDVSFFEIQKWFFNAFPELQETIERRRKIVNNNADALSPVAAQ